MHRGQQIVLQHPARIKFVCAGRRWRKTSMLMVRVVEDALKGKQILWTAPTFKQAEMGWRELYEAAQDVAKFTRPLVRFPGGGEVRFVSMEEPDNARGYTADGVVVDEAAMCRPEAWYDVLRPTISDTHGWAILASTPNGQNWFYQEWQRAKQLLDAASWQAPTLGAKIVGPNKIEREPHPLENPAFPFSELEAQVGGPEQTFRREYLADFKAQGVNLVFPMQVPVAKNLASFFDFKAARTTP